MVSGAAEKAGGSKGGRHHHGAYAVLVASVAAAVFVAAALQSQTLTIPRPVETASRDLGVLGELQSTGVDSENVLGSLASETYSSRKRMQKENHAIDTFSTVAESFKEKVHHLSAIGKALARDEAEVKALQKREQLKYRAALRSAKIAHQPKVPQDEAAKVAKLVLGAIEPQLKSQQAEISGLSSMLKAPRRMLAAKRYAKGLAASPDSGDKSLYAQMTNYLQNTFKKSTKAILNMVDYNMNTDLGAGGQDPGLGAEPILHNFAHPRKAISAPHAWKNTAVSWNSAPWQNPGAKGSPCSVAGSCSHGRFTNRDSEYWRKRLLERYAWQPGDKNKPPSGRYLGKDSVPPLAEPEGSDEVLLEHPLGEAVLHTISFKMPDLLPSIKASIPELPPSDFLVAAIGQFTIKHGGIYSFCTPSSIGSIVFVDDNKVVDNCRSSDEAEQDCGQVSLLSGKHFVRFVTYQGSQVESFSATYSGPDNKNIPSDIETSAGWVARAYKSSEEVWSNWYSTICSTPKKYYLGDEELMSDLDDFLPPNDAYIHDQLTSGNYGYDHFGKLAPMSKANQDLMYGNDFQYSNRQIMGKRLHSIGKGGPGHFSDRRSTLGDEQIDDDDREVPVSLANGEFKGEDHDRFGHWKWNSNLNQNLLNGMYWKHLKSDGLMDRLMPTNEAYSQLKGASHDSQHVADFAMGSWNIGHGRSSAFTSSTADILHQADTKLFSRLIGETLVPGLDFFGPATVEKNVKGLPPQDFAFVQQGTIAIRNSGTYTFCASSSDQGILFLDRSSVLFVDGTSSVNGTCVKLNLLAGEHNAKAVLFQSSPTGSFEATYSGPDTLFNETYEEKAIPAVPSWYFRAYQSSPSAFSAWYVAYTNPTAALDRWVLEHPEGWVQDRRDTQGNDWRNRVFTGTHERIEDRQGVVSNNLQDGGATGGFTGAYF